ncbi:hypothetical protein GCM10011505_18670 [Tistrella bauzanensis]|uniref:Cholesterol oxidase n=1 Tax=Tistrella bauzanensis TaxID=657419 RepID=A0ABQ1IF52_9PROT|nr:GMC oxidoreductase [Tistrella bauzanensis]GGB37458.1 hypothetical protein GCM10011505_18670 [Tistrella bauzanensis]
MTTADGAKTGATTDWDVVVVGSGFGGSVSALRLAEKGYRVLVVEQGRRFAPDDFPTTNRQLSRWLWAPSRGWRGPFRMTLLKHQTILSGVGVGGGSLVYGATLPVPRDGFYDGGDWRGLADWRAELAPHYQMARRMLGVATQPRREPGDTALYDLAAEDGRADHAGPTEVGIFFGDGPPTPNSPPGPDAPAVADPYFDGAGPDRQPCRFCAACMLGCRHGAKNTLDRNYLWLAERLGAEVRAETTVTDVRPLPTSRDGGNGYVVTLTGTGLRTATKGRKTPLPVDTVTAGRVVFAGGVLGTVPLLLRLKRQGSLPALSDRLGHAVRTNSEAVIQVQSLDDTIYATGIGITAGYTLADGTHIELVRYPPGSNVFAPVSFPHGEGATAGARLRGILGRMLRHPRAHARALFRRDRSAHSNTILAMQTGGGCLRLDLDARGRLISRPDTGPLPTAVVPAASAFARRFAQRINGIAFSLITETLAGKPTTAHILGGAVIGADASRGVIDTAHRLFGYDGLYVVDGSAVPSNPGVNPSLTITAMAERAMALIPAKGDHGPGRVAAT